VSMCSAPLVDAAHAARPRLSEARVVLTRERLVNDHAAQVRAIRVPVERRLAICLNRREIVTLMTLDQEPEWLALRSLLNQRLIEDLHRHVAWAERRAGRRFSESAA